MNKPKNFGSKWSEDEKEYLIKNLNSNEHIIDVVNKIAKKLERSEGGVHCEIRRIIINHYLKGEDQETIGDLINVSNEYIQSVIKKYLEKNAEEEIKLLERENNLLKLRIDNAKLQNELKNAIKNEE